MGIWRTAVLNDALAAVGAPGTTATSPHPRGYQEQGSSFSPLFSALRAAAGAL